jgi:hypothetical protein
MVHMLTRLIIKKLPLMLALGIAAAAPVHPMDPFTVSGECQVPGRGLLHVFLVDERSFSVAMGGMQAVTSGSKARPVALAFIVSRGSPDSSHGACTEGPAAPQSEGGQF